MIPPNVPGISCPTDLTRYVPDVEKDDNKWVKIGSDGCIQYVDGSTMQWTSSNVCGLDEFVDWCWLDNVSEDEYAGHMFALGAVAKLVDDPDVQSSVKGLLSQIGDHLIDNQLEFKDWDGRTTEHGRIWAWLVVGGYNATMSLSFLKTIAEATGDDKYESYYQDCLLQRSGPKDCFDDTSAAYQPYDEILTPTGLYLGCKANWNNFSMHMLSLHGLIWSEHEPELRRRCSRRSLRTCGSRRTNSARSPSRTTPSSTSSTPQTRRWDPARMDRRRARSKMASACCGSSRLTRSRTTSAVRGHSAWRCARTALEIR